MDTKKMIGILEEQERLLRFKNVDFNMLADLCMRICSRIENMGKSAYIRADLNGILVFALCMPGATYNNEDWARRKSNLTLRYSISSLHATLNMKENGKTLEICGMDNADYGLSGGSFPILLESGIAVGSITVSGMTEWEDHQVIADVLAEELGMEIPSVLI